MTSEFEFDGDYATLGTLMLLQHLQETGQELTFATGLVVSWRKVAARMPDSCKHSLDFTVLSLFFLHMGKLADAVKYALDHLASRVPPDQHAEGLRIAQEHLERGKAIFTLLNLRR